MFIEKYLGDVDPTTITKTTKDQPTKETGKDHTPISMCLSLNDIEVVASKSLPRDAWAYFHSASDNLGAERNNRVDWTKIILRPRVLRNVQRVDMTQTIMGQRSALPFFVAPAALAKMAHPEGECCIVRGVARAGIPYCASSVSSISHVDLVRVLREETQAKPDNEAIEGCLLFQLYAAVDPAKTEQRIQTAIDLGFKALVLTVDTPVAGKREETERHLAEMEWTDNKRMFDTSKWMIRQFDDPTLFVLRGFNSCTLDWKEVKRLKELWAKNTVNGLFTLKGIQTVEDAIMAVEEAGVNVIYLSNHGGRQCDDAPSAIRTLLEIRRFAPHLLDKAEFYLDGGIRRGADIVKAIALGARGVAMGRPFLYALGAYGTEGVEHVIKSIPSPFCALI
jgi:L-lactate dehydrogenase (cytochrome)